MLCEGEPSLLNLVFVMINLWSRFVLPQLREMAFSSCARGIPVFTRLELKTGLNEDHGSIGSRRGRGLQRVEEASWSRDVWTNRGKQRRG